MASSYHVTRLGRSWLRPTMFNLPAPPGFVGFDEKAPMRIYTRHLPHWRQEGVTYFVTFRLADSLPQGRLRELVQMREGWIHHLAGRSRDEARLRPTEERLRGIIERVEEWLDEGYGCCVLKERFAADCVEQKLRHFDGKQYDLCAFVIMPNHVHALVKPYSDERHPVERVVQGWKAHSSREINRSRGVRQQLWQEESFDRIVRDEEHLWYCVQYIGSNPRRVGLRPEHARRWIRPDWEEAGWRFEDLL